MSSGSTPADRDWFSRERVLALALGIATILSLYVCYLIVKPFIPALAFALALAVATHKPHDWLYRRLNNNTLTAAIAVILVALVIIAPLTALVTYIVQQIVTTVRDSQGGGGKSLFCSTCLSAWPFPRVQCAHCGETDEPRLGYFHSPTYAHVRIEVCDACHHYQKAVDRSRLGLADPLVDEVATAALDLWAREHGYTKIEMNLIGL